MPLVSIILPTYNGNKSRLSEAINSILSQTFSDFELIIINDASTNDIETTILRYAEQEPRIVYVKNDINLKLTATLNKALWLAKWEFIARIDDDDIRIDTEKLQKQVNFLKEYQEYGMCGAKWIISINEEGEKLWTTQMRSSNREIKTNLLASNQFTHSSIMIRKSVLDQLGNYNPLFNLAEDYELWCRVWTQYKLANIDTQVACRQNSKSVSRKAEWKQKILAFKVAWKYREYFPGKFRAFLLRIISFILSPKLISKILSVIKKRWKSLT